MTYYRRNDLHGEHALDRKWNCTCQSSCHRPRSCQYHRPREITLLIDSEKGCSRRHLTSTRSHIIYTNYWGEACDFQGQILTLAYLADVVGKERTFGLLLAQAVSELPDLRVTGGVLWSLGHPESYRHLLYMTST